MDDWGVRNCDIEVLHWGSFSASMETMKTRVNFPHVRTMMREITTRLSGGGRYAQTDSLSNTTPATAMAAPSKLFAFGTSPSL